MYHPTTRVLTVLELLQSYPGLSGADLARRLEVDVRTVRRYVVMLQDMGIPVETERGRHGGYSLRPGFKMPPLMFSEDEALAVILGLHVARHIGFSSTTASVEGALAKIERVLPADLRQKVNAVEENMIIEMEPPEAKAVAEGSITTIGTAIQQERQIELHYEAFDGEVSIRAVDPYGLVYRVGRWYMVGYCHLRQDLRTFRLDRTLEVTLLEGKFSRPSDFDALHHVEQAIARTPGIYHVQVLFDASEADVRQQIPPAHGRLIPQENGILLDFYVQNLPWIAGYLAGLTLPMTILTPEALKAEMRVLIQRVHAILK